MHNNIWGRISTVVLGVVATFFIFLAGYEAFVSRPNHPTRKPEAKTLTVSAPEPEIRADHAFIVSLENGTIYLNKNALTPRPISSIAKLMTAVIAAESAPESALFRVSKEDLEIEGEAGNLRLNELLTLRQLLYLTLISSSNDAAFVLTRPFGTEEFVARMNQKAKILNMQTTRFVDPAGLSLENVSSAYDLAILAGYIQKNHPEIFEITTLSSLRFFSQNGIPHNLQTTNLIVDKIKNLVGAKTGFDPDVGGALLIVSRIQNQNFFSVVLTSPDRFSDMLQLIEWIGAAAP